MARANARIIRHAGDVAVIRGKEVAGVFTEGGTRVVLDEHTVIDRKPTFDCLVSDLPDGIVNDERAEIDERAFFVKEIYPPGGDETGWVTLELSE